MKPTYTVKTNAGHIISVHHNVTEARIALAKAYHKGAYIHYNEAANKAYTGNKTSN